MFQEIDPTNMNEAEALFLQSYLARSRVNFFPFGINHINPKQSFNLLSILLLRPRNRIAGEFCYQILAPKPFASGGTAYGYKSPGQLSFSACGKLYFVAKPCFVKIFPYNPTTSAAEKEHHLMSNYTTDLIPKKPIVFLDPSNQQWMMAFCMPLIPGPDLANLYKNRNLTIKEILSLSLEAAWAVKLRHDFGIVHRDIKPENFIVSQDPLHIIHLTLIDLGFSHLIDAKESNMVSGTTSYIPPEILCRLGSTKKADSYSFGRLLSFLLKAPIPAEIQFKPPYEASIRDEYYTSVGFYLDSFNFGVTMPQEFREELNQLISEAINLTMPPYLLDGTDIMRLHTNLAPEETYLLQAREGIIADAEARLSIEEIIARLERLHFNASYTLPIPHDIIQCFYQAREAREKIRIFMLENIRTRLEPQNDVITSANLLATNMGAMKQIILDMAKPCLDQPFIIEQFVKTLRVSALQDCLDKAALTSRLGEIEQNFKKELDDLAAQHQLVSFFLIWHPQERLMLNKLIAEILADHNHIKRCVHTIDEIVSLTKRLHKTNHLIRNELFKTNLNQTQGLLQTSSNSNLFNEAQCDEQSATEQRSQHPLGPNR